jgi:hypothetical protein
VNGNDRFERMIRWYPTQWRARYGDEMAALLEDTHGMSAVPLRDRISLAKSGSMERAREAGLIGDSSEPDERIRTGSLLVLCGWALFMVAGAIFAKFTEHWDAVFEYGRCDGTLGDRLLSEADAEAPEPCPLILHVDHRKPTTAAMPHMVNASANYSWRITLRLSGVIGSKPARTWRVGIACATPHRATSAAAA